MKKLRPPKISSIILNRLLSPYDGTTAPGDLEEEYNMMIKVEGESAARNWYRRQVWRSIPLFFRNQTQWSLTMFKNYLKIAFRTMIRQKGFSSINISGLAIGMACCLVMVLWAHDELSYDRYHENIDSIYRIVDGPPIGLQQDISALSSPPLANALKRDYPEIIRASRFDWTRRVVKYREVVFNESNYMNVDPDFFEIFSFPFIIGDRSTALKDPRSVVLTRETAEKYFGDENPIGKVMKVDNRIEVTVTGVIENVPDNSTLDFDLLSPFAPPWFNQRIMTNYGANMLYSFVMLDNNVNVDELVAKISDYLIRLNPDETDTVDLQWFGDIHLRSNLDHELYGTSDIKYVYIFAALAVFVLLIACINFMNLTTARSGNRGKEIGMRKVSGAYRSHLLRQFFSESVLFSVISLLFALVLVNLLMPVFENISGKNLSMNAEGSFYIYLILIVITLLTGFLSGTYPAVFLSSLRPLAVLKGNKSSVIKHSGLRKSLVVLQFSLSVFLIICTLIIVRQLDYMRSKELGYEKSHLLVVNMSGNVNTNFGPFKKEILKRSDVLNVSRSMSLPTSIRSTPGSPEFEGKESSDEWLIRADFVDYDYFETFGMEIVQGRSFSQEHATDDSLGYVVNETAVSKMRMEDPIGKKFNFWENKGGHIIGVVKDFHFRSLHNEIEPIVFSMFDNWLRRIIIKIEPENVSGTVTAIEKVWKEIYPDNPFDYTFYDEGFDRLYRAENRMQKVVNSFTFLAIFIACLGLFGLAAFMAEQKTKEIGIRKVLGSKVSSIVLMFSSEFIKWVVVANMIAWPAAWFTMNTWLTGFAYRADFSVLLFLITGVISIMIALITVGYQTIKAAFTNPVDALKYE